MNNPTHPFAGGRVENFPGSVALSSVVRCSIKSLASAKPFPVVARNSLIASIFFPAKTAALIFAILSSGRSAFIILESQTIRLRSRDGEFGSLQPPDSTQSMSSRMLTVPNYFPASDFSFWPILSKPCCGPSCLSAYLASILPTPFPLANDTSSGVTGIYFGGGHALGADAASNNLFSAVLVIVSGSGGSADMPPVNTNGIPIIMGEHSCLGDNKANCNMYMYSNKSSGNDASTVQGDKQYMTVLSPNHPIMQGIPLDAQNRVKIWRNPYPEEDAVHTPTGAKLNYRYSWTYVDISAGLSVPAPDTTIIGVQGDNANHAVFAVNPAGGMLADGTSSHGNYVQLFVNEHGSGDARRAFNALTDIGRVIFIRTCKWAMGETLTPYQPLGLIKVSQVGPTSIQLSWDGRADKNYKVLGTQNISGPADFSNWQTVDEDIHGANGTISVTYNIGSAKQYAFLRVTQVP